MAHCVPGAARGCGVVVALFHLAQGREPRLREVDSHCHGHTARKVGGHALSHSWLPREPHSFHQCGCLLHLL